MNLKGKLVLISDAVPQEKTAGGIYIPQTLQKPRNIGRVIAVGDKADQSLIDKDVVFHIQSSQKFEHEGTKGILIYEADLIATL